MISWWYGGARWLVGCRNWQDKITGINFITSDQPLNIIDMQRAVNLEKTQWLQIWYPQVIQLFTWVEFNGQLFVTHLTDTRFTNWKIFINKKDVVVKYSWRLTKSAWSNPWKYLLRPCYIIAYEKDLLEVIKRSYCSLHQPPPPTPPQYSLTWQLLNRGRRNTLMAGVQPSTVTTSYNSYS